LRKRVKAGTAHARLNGKSHGKRNTTLDKKDEIPQLKTEGLNNSHIAKKLKIILTSVIPVPRVFFNRFYFFVKGR
jgi:DNA invertase Pin-like site-specific DNA recombinase